MWTPRLAWPVELVLPSCSHPSPPILLPAREVVVWIVAGEGTVQLVLEGEADEEQTHVTTLPQFMSELNLRLKGRCVMSVYSYTSKRCYFIYLAGQPG